MARINLLPWRENLRRQRKRNFYLMLLATVLLAALTLVLWHLQVQAEIEYQNARNDFLRNEIAKVNTKIREIRDIEKRREQLIARMNVIQALQVSRPMVVHMFDELVKTIPDGVYLDQLTQTGEKVALNGWAQSNARISAYMRNIERSLWLADPQLKVIKNKDEKSSDPGAMARFTLELEQANPNGPVDGDQNEGAKAKARGRQGKR